MRRTTKKIRAAAKWQGIDLRKLRKELKLIPFDIKREMRFLDLLFSERNVVRTQAEQEVLRELIDRARDSVRFHQNRLIRFQTFYDTFKRSKSFDNTLLLPDEVHSLLKSAPMTQTEPPCMEMEGLRTGTDG